VQSGFICHLDAFRYFVHYATAYLLYTYAANAKIHILGGKMNLLESCFEGWVIYVWGLPVEFGGFTHQVPLSSFLSVEVKNTKGTFQTRGSDFCIISIGKKHN